MNVKFECPKCKSKSPEKIDDRFDRRDGFSSERIQDSDDLNCDPKTTSENKIELWWCCFCGTYFQVYYKLTKILSLEKCEKIID